MAAADYYLCDVCDAKCFYDANLNWEMSTMREPIPEDECVAGKPGMKLGYCGDIAAICLECAKTHEICVIPRSQPQMPNNEYVMVRRELLDDDLLEAIQEWAAGADQTINVGEVEIEGHDTHLESAAGCAVRLIKQLRALLGQKEGV